MAQQIRKTKEEIKRKYNAAYRLRKKISEKAFPQRSKVIYTSNLEQVVNNPEAQILLSEFGFIIKPELF